MVSLTSQNSQNPLLGDLGEATNLPPLPPLYRVGELGGSSKGKKDIPAAAQQSCPSGALGNQKRGGDGFKLACKMLRKAGKLDFSDLLAPRRSESIADWMVRAGLSASPQAAIEGLMVAADLAKLRDELLVENLPL